MITIPVVLSIGLPPHLTTGTSRLQSICGTITSTIPLQPVRGGFYRHRRLQTDEPDKQFCVRYFFLMEGKVVFTVGLVMAAGQIQGTFNGSHMVIHRSPW